MAHPNRHPHGSHHGSNTGSIASAPAAFSYTPPPASYYPAPPASDGSTHRRTGTSPHRHRVPRPSQQQTYQTPAPNLPMPSSSSAGGNTLRRSTSSSSLNSSPQPTIFSAPAGGARITGDQYHTPQQNAALEAQFRRHEQLEAYQQEQERIRRQEFARLQQQQQMLQQGITNDNALQFQSGLHQIASGVPPDLGEFAQYRSLNDIPAEEFSRLTQEQLDYFVSEGGYGYSTGQPGWQPDPRSGY